MSPHVPSSTTPAHLSVSVSLSLCLFVSLCVRARALVCACVCTGVTASIAVAVIVRGQLWGLMIGHHWTPKFISYQVSIRHVTCQ